MLQRTAAQLVIVISVLLAVAPALLLSETTADTPAPPAFEVASIRQNIDPHAGWRLEFTANGVHAKAVTLLWALHEAYGVYDNDLWSGGPAWLSKARFDIEAKYDVSAFPNLSHEQRQAMLQQLLAERFRVVLHRETKEFPLYALVVAKNGPKFTETKSEDQRMSSTNSPICVVSKRGKGELEMRGCTMAEFAEDVSGYGQTDLGRKAVDRTQLAGRYTLALHWLPMDTTANGAESNASTQSGPPIFTAVKEQLGLELKPMKGPLDVMVIDQAQMPAEIDGP